MARRQCQSVESMAMVIAMSTSTSNCICICMLSLFHYISTLWSCRSITWLGVCVSLSLTLSHSAPYNIALDGGDFWPILGEMYGHLLAYKDTQLCVSNSLLFSHFQVCPRDRLIKYACGFRISMGCVCCNCPSNDLVVPREGDMFCFGFLNWI